MKNLISILILILLSSNYLYSQNIKPDLTYTPKNKSMAITMGVANTIAPPLLAYYLGINQKQSLGKLILGYGILAGPAMGNYYAHDMKRFYWGVGLRLGSMLFYSTYFEDGVNNDTGAYIMATTILTTTIWNIWTAPKSVQEYNDKNINLSLAPCYLPQSRSVGIALNLNF